MKSMEDDEREILLGRKKQQPFSSYYSIHDDDAVESKSLFTWVFLDQSSLWRAGLSWSIFFLLTIGVPLLSHFVFHCSTCDHNHRRPHDAVLQLSLSLFATLSFISLSSFARKYGLRRFLFLDKLCHVSKKVQQGYTQQLHGSCSTFESKSRQSFSYKEDEKANEHGMIKQIWYGHKEHHGYCSSNATSIIQRSMKLLCGFVLPCLVADIVYKIWWFISGGTQIPYFYNVYLSHTIACTLQMCSWLYRTSIFLMVCVLFRLICYLHILRLEDFSEFFRKESDVGSILLEHLTIRRNLRIISHRFRVFILWTLLLVTATQFASLLVTTHSASHPNIFTAGELGLCSITLVTGLFICLRSAAKITHRAQSVTSLAAKWHICATIDSFDALEDERTPRAQITSPRVNAIWESDNEEGDGDNELDNTNMVPIHAHTISYQKRQALVSYFENNRAGITVFGFMLDRTSLHTLFVIQLSLTLWLLNRTVGIS